uniref:UBN2 domain-containing protein n=1 Tax=Cannabis sativa TaxID=3483 RepID=A0A803P602_CANSA
MQKASYNSKAMHSLFNTVSTNELKVIVNCEVGKDAWKKLRINNEGADAVKKYRLLSFAKEFVNLSMEEDETVAEFNANLCHILNDSHALGKTYSNAKIVRKVLGFFPRKFKSNVTSIEEMRDVEELDLDEVIESLQNYEMTFTSGSSATDIDVTRKIVVPLGPTKLLCKGRKTALEGQLQRERFVPVCHFCNKRGHIRPRLMGSIHKLSGRAKTSDTVGLVAHTGILTVVALITRWERKNCCKSSGRKLPSKPRFGARVWGHRLHSRFKLELRSKVGPGAHNLVNNMVEVKGSMPRSRGIRVWLKTEILWSGKGSGSGSGPWSNVSRLPRFGACSRFDVLGWSHCLRSEA